MPFGMAQIGFGFRRDGQSAHIHGLGQLIYVGGQARLTESTQDTPKRLGIAHLGFSARRGMRRSIEQHCLDIGPDGHITGHRLERSFLLKAQAQRKRRVALGSRLNLPRGYLIEIMARNCHFRTSDRLDHDVRDGRPIPGELRTNGSIPLQSGPPITQPASSLVLWITAPAGMGHGLTRDILFQQPARRS